MNLILCIHEHRFGTSTALFHCKQYAADLDNTVSDDSSVGAEISKRLGLDFEPHRPEEVLQFIEIHDAHAAGPFDLDDILAAATAADGSHA